MPKELKRARQAQSSLDIGVYFEPLECRLLLSGSWDGAVIDNQFQDSQQPSQHFVEAEYFTFCEQDTTTVPDLLQGVQEEASSEPEGLKSEPM